MTNADYNLELNILLWLTDTEIWSLTNKYTVVRINLLKGKQ